MASARPEHKSEPWKDPGAQPYVRLEKLTKKFGDFVAVDDVTLNIYRNEIFCLLGGSGSGKTTLLRMMAGFERPTEGRIWIDGVDVTATPPYERRSELSTWRNISQMWGSASAGMPTPLSCTLMTQWPPPSVAATCTPPWLVNLSALPTRFLTIVFNLRRSVRSERCGSLDQSSRNPARCGRCPCPRFRPRHPRR